jgi:hypothetical protein
VIAMFVPGRAPPARAGSAQTMSSRSESILAP